MKVDFHLHTSEYSGCAMATAEEQIRSAKKSGLDVIFITDHMTLFPMEVIKDYNKQYAPLKIYQGIEVTIMEGAYEDLLVLGVHDSKIEGKQWKYEDLYAYVKKKGGAIILAHPYRFADEVNVNIWDYPPDAVEVLSSNIGRQNYERRRLLANTLECPMVTNSDSHYIEHTGCYYNIFPDRCVDEASIIEALKNGDFECSSIKT